MNGVASRFFRISAYVATDIMRCLTLTSYKYKFVNELVRNMNERLKHLQTRLPIGI